jgi:pSer/pThr/pTyr-binding forkhead associated (FHA) protein
MPYVAVFAPGAGEPRRYPLSDATVSFGRSSGNDVCIDDPNVSRRHCTLSRADGRWVLHDLGSTNGTWLDAARVKRYALRDGETFYVGDARVVFHIDQYVEHRPLDPNEAQELAKVLEQKRARVEAILSHALCPSSRRTLPQPRATVVTRHRPHRAAPLKSLAFQRPPAMPLVRDRRGESLVHTVLKLVHA